MGSLKHKLLSGIAALLIVGSLAAQELATDPRLGFIDEAVTAFPTSLDPHQVFNPYWNPVFGLCYETPLTCKLQDGRLVVAPLLLAEAPTLSADGLTMVLKVHPEARFADDPCFEKSKGRSVGAKDLAHTILRHADPSSGSVYFDAYFRNRFEGLDALRAAAEMSGRLDYQAKVSGLKVVDEKTLRLKLKQPYPQLSALMTMPVFSVIPPEATRFYGSGLAEHCVGSGPYRYDRKMSGATRMIFSARRDYWGRFRQGKKPVPANAGVRWRIVKDQSEAESLFAAGEIDFLDLNQETQSRFLNVFNRLKRSVKPKGSHLVDNSGARLHYIAFNLKNKVLANKKLRQALSLALDRDAYVRSFYKRSADPAEHLVPPAIPMATPKSAYPWAYGGSDLKRAKKLLAEAGFPGGKGLPEFVLDLPYEGPQAQEEIKIIERSWKAIGVRLQPRAQPFTKFLERSRQGQIEIAVSYWFADYPDPENFFLMLRSESAPAPDKTIDSPNIGFYLNPKYDALYRKASVLSPGPARGRILEKMIEMVQEDCPWVFVAWPRSFSVVGPRVANEPTRNRYVLNYRDVQVQWR